jgi:hypothetical protein
MDEVDEQPVGALTMVWVRRSLQKVRAGLMAGVCLGAVAAHATDATWSPDAANNNWNDGANWVSNPPHVVPDGNRHVRGVVEDVCNSPTMLGPLPSLPTATAGRRHFSTIAALTVRSTQIGECSE